MRARGADSARKSPRVRKTVQVYDVNMGVLEKIHPLAGLDNKAAISHRRSTVLKPNWIT